MQFDQGNDPIRSFPQISYLLKVFHCQGCHFFGLFTWRFLRISCPIVPMNWWWGCLLRRRLVWLSFCSTHSSIFSSSSSLITHLLHTVWTSIWKCFSLLSLLTFELRGWQTFPFSFAQEGFSRNFETEKSFAATRRRCLFRLLSFDSFAYTRLRYRIVVALRFSSHLWRLTCGQHLIVLATFLFEE